jgi:hypothetical protein
MNYTYLQIADDPTTWQLSEPAGASALTSQQPFQAAVVAGRNGTLILSSRAAPSAVLSGVGNAIPSGGQPGSPPYLYLPSSAGLKPTTPGYELPEGADLAALQAEITTAMTQQTSCTVQTRDGVLLLNGATLAFVVLFPALPEG